MTAPLINLVDGTPMDVEGWKFIGSKAESMSSYVRNARQHKKAWNADALAERRVWGRGVFATLRIQHKPFPDREVIYIGGKKR